MKIDIDRNGEMIMLVMFRVKNFASFKDETILDLRAVSYKEMKSHIVRIDKNNLVKTLAIYGKNASGKSNLVSAMYYFKSFIINQMYRDITNKEEEDTFRIPGIHRNPYRLNVNLNKENEFEIIFYHNCKTYQYGFSTIEENGKYLIKEEWLLKDNVEIYNRNYEHIRFGKKYEKELKKIINKRKDRLYISVLDYFSDGEIKEIIDDIKFYLKYKFIIHFEIFIETSIKGLLSNVNFSKRLINDNNYRSKVEKFLQIADVGIKRIDIEEILDEETNEHQRYKIKTIHDIFNDENEVIGEEAFDLKMESTGTIRYFSFIQNMLDMMGKGGVFIVDELTARLHPILTKFIIDLYQNEKNNKAQLIFTTHDISLLNRQQFRRDEIAFVDKNKKGESTVFTLADIKVRSDASFSKDYLFGKYGAIPVINEQDMTEEILEEWIWGD